jgi:histidinol dehydrogenase
VADTIANVEAKGASAVLESARRFDCPTLHEVWVSPAELQEASIAPADEEALDLAITRVSEFHATQLSVILEGWEELESGYGWRTSAMERDVVDEEKESISLGPIKVPVPEERRTSRVESGMLGQRLMPMARVGVYVPGGKASYPSSVYMNVVPAQSAGVKEIVIATPAAPDGSVSPALLVAARKLGITRILKCGGAAAVAALALGIEDMPRVDVLVGPGNTWVNEAKRQLWGTVGLTAYAGPSEVAVLAFPDCDPLVAAADLITQVEHSDDNGALLVVFSQEQARDILDAAKVMVDAAPRADSLRRALAEHGAVVVCSSETEAYQAVNDYAPEHLAILGGEPEEAVTHIVNAGCIALGHWTAQSAGDYVSGPSHTLPTSGAARFGSPVNVMDFLRFQSITSLERDDILELAPTIERLSALEGFPSHGQGAEIRRRLRQSLGT